MDAEPTSKSRLCHPWLALCFVPLVIRSECCGHCQYHHSLEAVIRNHEQQISPQLQWHLAAITAGWRWWHRPLHPGANNSRIEPGFQYQGEGAIQIGMRSCKTEWGAERRQGPGFEWSGTRYGHSRWWESNKRNWGWLINWHILETNLWQINRWSKSIR